MPECVMHAQASSQNEKSMSQLRKLGLKHKTDKAGGRENPDNHEFCEAYEFFLADLRDKQFSMLEIGIGGYHYPDRGGESLRMWAEYFYNARIYAMDLHKKDFPLPPRTKIFQGSQDDADLLRQIVDTMREQPKLIIDDASHNNILTLKTFEIAFPLLAPGGIYVVEDAHTSYWADHFNGGLHTPVTAMEYFKQQADYINHRHWQNIPHEMYHAKMEGIESIHFFPEIIFIRKSA